MEAPPFTLVKTSFEIRGITRAGFGANEPGEDWKARPDRLFVDGIEILPQPSQQIRMHSRAGLSWGYPGQGAAQSALALCLHLFGDPGVAEALYQAFKLAFVAQWKPIGRSFTVTIDVADFLIDHRELLHHALLRAKQNGQVPAHSRR